MSPRDRLGYDPLGLLAAHDEAQERAETPPGAPLGADSFARWVAAETAKQRARAAELIDSEDDDARADRAATVFAREARHHEGHNR